MSDLELEQVLRRALRAEDPGAAFSEQVLARLAAQEREAAPGPAALRVPARARGARWGLARHWLPAALAAGLLAGAGLAQWAHLQHQRALQTRTQLLLALNIASRYVDGARSAVLREEQSGP